MHGFLLASLLPTQNRSRVRVWTLAIGILLVLVVFVFTHAGRWLVSEDPLRKVDAIAVLSGKMPARALEAARLYKQGYSARVWVTRPKEPESTMERLSVPFQGEEFYDKQVLIHEGVPESAITILDPLIVNTADEMKTIRGEMQRENLHSVIIVSSKVHTRRVRALWNRISSQEGQAIVRGDSDDSFDPNRWWRHTQDALDVVREVLGLLNTWAGLPLKPAS
jgi:uncharacterized SAM-binding protein YcdF (DUF218 family)